MNNKKILYILAFLIKGWEVSLLLVLPILQTQGKINVFELGILAAFFSLFQIITSLFSGNLAERFGNKRVMTISVLFYTLAWAVFSLPVDFTSLLVVYCLGGVATGSFIPLANSQIAQISDKNRAKELGDFSAFSDVGRVVLTGIVTFMIGNISLFAASLTFAFLGFISTIVLVRSNILNIRIEEKVTLKPIKLHHLLKVKKFIFAVLTGMFDVFASASLFIFIPLLLIPKGINISSVGFLSALFFAGYLAGRVFLGRLADKYGSVKVLVISELLMAALIICLIFTSDFILVSAILFILGIFTRGTSPVIRAMMADSVFEKHRFDKAFSIHSFALTSSNVASRSVYGFSAGLFGITSVFYLSAFVALATLLPIYLYKRAKKYV